MYTQISQWMHDFWHSATKMIYTANAFWFVTLYTSIFDVTVVGQNFSLFSVSFWFCCWLVAQWASQFDLTLFWFSVLCTVMGYVFQSGEVTHKRTPYYDYKHWNIYSRSITVSDTERELSTHRRCICHFWHCTQTEIHIVGTLNTFLIHNMKYNTHSICITDCWCSTPTEIQTLKYTIFSPCICSNCCMYVYIYIYMTKCQKVHKLWVKILTVNKIWSD